MAKSENKKKKGLGWLWGILIALALIVGLLCAFIIMGLSIFFNVKRLTPNNNGGGDVAVTGGQNTPAPTSKPEATSGTVSLTNNYLDGRNSLLSYADYKERNLTYTPCIPSYEVYADLSNVDNADRFYLDDEAKALLSENGFYLENYNMSEFFEEYEYNRYSQLSSFVTVDSMMHTYHLYFAMLQKNTELNYLAADLDMLSKEMLIETEKQYKIFKGTEWEEAAKKNLVFYSVGAYLTDDTVDINDDIEGIVMDELNRINQAAGLDICYIIEDYEDYSQYKPRGYYEGDETLENYFKAMMWYGRMNFAQKDETMDRCALLSSVALNTSQSASEAWNEIYSVTSFFAGNSDDNGYYEYMPLIVQIYGDSFSYEDMIGDQKSFDEYHLMTSFLEAPQINSVVFADDNGATDKTVEAKGYRFMGQRFSVDAAIFEQLIYRKVGADSLGNYRMLPDALDVPAALGSGVALHLLDEQGDTDYANYSENMENMRNHILINEDTLFTGSLYAGWINTLRPLLEAHGEGYPSFMQNINWDKKDLECFVGSWTELKHDTVLYSKQVMAEMGGGDEEVYDDRGYVQPEPEVFERLAALSYQTAEGLDAFGILSDNDRENLNRLGDLAGKLSDISVKELENQSLTSEEYELIRGYGGTLEHFWKETVKDQAGSEYVDSEEFPAALVVDVATDPNGSVLEEAIGGATVIYVVFPIDGKLMLGRGTAYNYYQFVQPISDRMTDSEWRRKLGRELNEYGEYESDMSDIDKPWWTCDYRYIREYNW